MKNKFNLLKLAKDLFTKSSVSKLPYFSENKSNYILYFDFCLMILVAIFFMYDLLLILNFIIDKYLNLSVEICNMSTNAGTTGTSNNTTNTTIIHNNGAWSEAIRHIFIYGSGALRLHSHYARGGSPASRAFIICSTIAADGLSKVLTNVINDTNYVRNHVENWKIMRGTHENEPSINIVVTSKDTETNDLLSNVSNFNSNSIDNITEQFISKLLDFIRPVLEPVIVDYSNAILAQQINVIGIILFVLSILITILICSLLFNIILLVYSDKFMNLFTNKYIRWYININKKFIGLEVFFLGATILYFMYYLSYGIHFIATHPIIIS